MKSKKQILICSVLASSLLFSSCIGSFKLWHNLKGWNDGVGSKFVNELVFIGLHIVPVYELAYLADGLVLNSIEFWSGRSAMAKNEVKEVKGEDGIIYLVERHNEGYTLTNKDTKESLELVFNESTQTWGAQTENGIIELVKINEDGTATVNMQNGTAMTVYPDMQGVNAVRTAACGLDLAER